MKGEWAVPRRNAALRKLPFRRVAERRFGLPPSPVVLLAEGIQARAKREGRNPHELVDELLEQRAA
jgi:hypothetical protein